MTNEIEEQPSSQVLERTVIDEFDNVIGIDYVECPICDEGAMSSVIMLDVPGYLKIKLVKYLIQAPLYTEFHSQRNSLFKLK